MPLDPPPITITNPHAAAGDADSLGEDRDPWRPTRRQIVFATVVLLVAGLVTAGVQTVRHVRHGHDLDRAAIAQVRLVADLETSRPDEPPGGSIWLVWRNDGPDEVRLLSFRHDLAGAPATPLDLALPTGGSSVMALADPRGCEAEIMTQPATYLTVRLRTHRGQVLTRQVRMWAGAQQELNNRALLHCGYLHSDQAAIVEIGSSRLRDGDLELVYEVRNRSVLPLTWQGIAPFAGLRITSATPPTSVPPARAPGEIGAPLRLRVVVQVTDCQRLVATLFEAETSIVALQMKLTGQYDDAIVDVGLNTTYDGLLDTEADANNWLRNECRSTHYF